MNQVREVFDANTFVVIVGRDRMSGTAHEAHVRMKNTLRDKVLRYIRRSGISFPLAARAAELVIADKLSDPDTTVVYLTASNIADYLDQAQRDEDTEALTRGE